MIDFKCRKCGAEMEAPDSRAGGVERCPQCKVLNRVPWPPGTMSDPARIEFKCWHCSGQMKAPKCKAGYAETCPGCKRPCNVPVALNGAEVRTIRTHHAFQAYMQDFILPAIQHRDGRLLGRDRAFLDEDSLETVYAQRWYAERQAGTPEAEIDAAIRAKEDLTPVPLDKRRVPSSASDGYDPEFRAYMEREVWPFVMQCGGLLEYKGERFVSVNQLQADLNSR